MYVCVCECISHAMSVPMLVQARRRALQRPFELNYAPDGGRDGYYVLSPASAPST